MGVSTILLGRKIHNLPTLPEVAQRILTLTNDPLFSIDTLIDLISKDTIIIAKIMGLANSAFFGVSARTTKLEDAVMRIGLNNVKNIAIGISILTLLNDGKSSAGYRRLYNHMLSVGLTARSLAKKFKLPSADDILIEGLLHDIGLLVINKYFSDSYELIQEQMGEGRSMLDVEKEVTGYTHAEVGYWLAEQWNLPDMIRECILYHHAPSHARRNEKHVAVIHLTDYIVTQRIYSPFKGVPEHVLDTAYLDILSISGTTINDIEQTVCNIFNSTGSEESALSLQ